MSAKRVFVTGANSFIGRRLLQVLCDEGFDVVPGVRAESECNNEFQHKNLSKAHLYQAIGADTDWHGAFAGTYAVVHLAARVHITCEKENNPLAAYRQVNTFGTQKLAMEAASQGVEKFIFLSSIGVNGGSTSDKPFQETDEPAPHNDYSRSKLEAEVLLQEISAQSSMQLSIIRPPLVYGPGVKANFLSLLRLASTGYPLPFGSINNKRSFISLFNQVDFIHHLLTHSGSSGVYLVCDDDAISTSELIRYLRREMGLQERLFSLPYPLLSSIARFFGKHKQLEKMCGSLVIDKSKAEKILGWKPRQSVRDGLRDTVQWFKEND